MNRDKDGIIGQIQTDGSVEGGDSANWMGHWIYLTDEQFKFEKVFSVGGGAYVRHPHPDRTYFGFGAYYAHPWDGVISRDQMTGIIAGLIANKNRLGVLKLILHHMAWLFLFSYNTRVNGKDPLRSKWKWPDVTFVDIWALELRGLGGVAWVFFPLLCIFDLYILAKVLWHRLKINNDPISFTMKLIIAYEQIPTPVSWLAFKLLNRDKLIKELENYWCGWRDGCDILPYYEERLHL